MPVTTFSCKPSTQRNAALWSSAATKCISLVPGLAKQVSTPAACRVSTRLRAPFTAVLLVIARCPTILRDGHAYAGALQTQRKASMAQQAVEQESLKEEMSNVVG